MRYIGKRTTAITCRIAVVQSNQLHVYFNYGTAYPSVASTSKCHGTEEGKTDAKNDATAQKRGTFLHHEHKIQNGF